MSIRLGTVLRLLSAALFVMSVIKSFVYILHSRHDNVIVPPRPISERHRYVDNLYQGLDERIDNMQAQPIKVRPNYRTPCWYENLTVVDPYPITSHLYLRFFKDHLRLRSSYRSSFEKSTALFKRRLKGGLGKWRLRCLPFFYLIGTNRGGTTGLWTSLMSHPHVAGSDAAKELHYWNEIRYGAGLEKMGYGAYLFLIRNDTIPRPLKSYVDVFDSAAERIRKTYIVDRQGRRFHPIVLGEGSPNYLTDFGNWQMLPANKGFTEPKYTVAHIVKMLTPQAHIVVSLRDPIKRLISEYTSYRRHENKTEEQFHRLASDAIKMMKLCLTNRTLRSCAYDIDLASQTQPVILLHSLYYPFIRDWLEVFTSKQMIILRSEDFYKDPEKVTNEVFKFFGLDTIKKVKTGGRNARLSQRRDFVPYPKTLDMLRDFFKPYNRHLATYLGSDKFLWSH